MLHASTLLAMAGARVIQKWLGTDANGRRPEPEGRVNFSYTLYPVPPLEIDAFRARHTDAMLALKLVEILQRHPSDAAVADAVGREGYRLHRLHPECLIYAADFNS